MRRLGRPIVIGSLLLAGCTPGQYARQADRQVQQLITDRQKQALSYTPEVDAAMPEAEALKTSRKTYAKLPTTELPDPVGDVIFEPKDSPAFGPIGPTPDEPERVVASDSGGVAAARRYAVERYRLGPPAEANDAQRFGLFESIAYAVANSRAYRTQMENLYQTALGVTLERHLFSPRPFANLAARYTGSQQTADYASALRVTSEAGVRQRLPYGGEVVASGLVEFVNALNEGTSDGENAQLALSTSIPLLRGAGPVAQESLIQAERDLVYAVREFEQYRRDFAIQIASSYFRLLTSQQAIRNRYVRYLNTLELVARSEALFEKGDVAAIEVQRAQQDLLQSEDAVNNAIRDYENQLDRFKLLIGMPVDQKLEVVGVLIEVPLPDLSVQAMSEVAVRYRLDLQTARDRVADAQRNLKNAQNALLPSLDFTASGTLGNRSNTPAAELTADDLNYSAGLELDLPIDRLSERNAYRRALIALGRAQRNVKQLEDQVLADVRSAVRGIESAQVSLELQRRGIEIARERLDAANAFLLTGKSNDTRNALEAQASLLQAQDSYEQARANLQIAILEYLRDTSLLRLDPDGGTLGIATDRVAGRWLIPTPPQ